MSDCYQQLQDICPIHTENVRLSKVGTGQMSDHKFLLGKTLDQAQEAILKFGSGDGGVSMSSLQLDTMTSFFITCLGTVMLLM